MGDFPLRVLPLVPAIGALLSGVLGSRSRVLAWRAAGAAQALTLGACGFAAARVWSSPSESWFDSVYTWVGIGDLVVRANLRLDAVAAGLALIVAIACALGLRSSRRADGGLERAPWLLGSQAAALAAVMLDALPLGLFAWGVTALLHEGAARAGGLTEVDWQRRFMVHRLSDASWFLAALWLHVEGVEREISGAFASPISIWIPGLLSLSLAIRVAALRLRAEPGWAQVPGAGVVLVSGAHVIGWSGFQLLTSGTARWRWLGLALLLAILGAWMGRAKPSGGLGRLVFAPLMRLLLAAGRGVHALQAWVFDGFLLQGPAVIVDASARLLRLLHGGDVQRYVAMGLLGWAGLVYLTTRPAAAPRLECQTDGLTVRVDAGRGPVSASRLEFDYDFDGDDRPDRVGAGARASFTYAVAGAYRITVTIRDPLWRTERKLHSLVEVGR